MADKANSERSLFSNGDSISSVPPRAVHFCSDADNQVYYYEEDYESGSLSDMYMMIEEKRSSAAAAQKRATILPGIVHGTYGDWMSTS